MIRLINRRLIIPRGDTGSFTVPVLTNSSAADISVFTIFDCLTRRKVFQKEIIAADNTLTVEFTHEDTVNLVPGRYVWDIKYYKNPTYAEGELIDGEEVDSYYAGFSLPVCEIKETGDTLLLADDAPTSTMSPLQLNVINAAISETNASKRDAATSASAASASANEANASAAAALQSQTDAEDAAGAAINAKNAAISASETAVSAKEIAKAAESNAQNAASTATENATTAVASAEEAATALNELKEILPSLAPVATSGSYNDLLNVPTNVSTFTNDAGYLTQHQDISGKANSADLATVATSGNYNDLLNKPFIPSAVSDLTDDSGHYTKPVGGIPAADLAETYLTSFTETDPTVSSWAKQPTKPSYTPQEVGALPADTYIPQKTSDLTNDSNYAVDANYVHTDNNYTTAEKNKLSGIAAGAEVNVNADWNASSGDAQILNKPTKVSVFTNDVGYLTSFTETDPTVPAWAKAAQKPSYTAAEVGAPTVAEMNSAISSAIGNINSFDMAVVQELPSQDISTHTIYLVPKTGETNDVYDEYVYINNAWEMIGNTQIDLSNYALKSELPTKVSELNNDSGYLTSYTETDPTVPQWAKAVTKPSYTAVEVGALPNNTHIPTTTAELTNDAGFITSADLPTKISDLTNDAGYLTQHQDISSKADKVSGAIIGNFAALDSNGNLSDSGHKHGDYLTSHQDISGKADKVSGGTTGNFVSLDNNGNIADSGHKHSDYLTAHQDVSGKADKVSSATNGNFASLDANGNLTDSGHKHGDYLTEHQTIPVQDVQVNGTSIVSDGVANVPIASSSTFGAVKCGTGLTMMTGNNAGKINTNPASTSACKNGTEYYAPITPNHQHEATFYGLAKAAGDTTQSASSNEVGTYTDNAKASIKSMLGIVDGSTGTVDITGTTPTITAVENTRYVCGEVATLSFTPPASGISIVRFTSGTTAAVLTLPSTVKFPEWFDATALEANTIYEMCITDGIYGAVMSWAL